MTDELITVQPAEGVWMLSFDVNLTQDVCYDRYFTGEECDILGGAETASRLIEDIGGHIPDIEERERFLCAFSPQRLLDSYHSGVAIVSDAFFFRPDRGADFVARITAGLHCGAMKNNVYAYLLIADISEQYYDEKLLKMLYEREYCFIAVINLEHRSLRVLAHDTEGGKVGRRQPVIDYDDLIVHRFATSYTRQESALFRERTALPYVEERLFQSEEYSFSRRCEKHGAPRFFRYRYTYFNRGRRLLLLTVEDITSEQETDALTGLYSRFGFMNAVKPLLREQREPWAVLYFNIRNFKAINDRIGYRNGDNVLRFVSRQIHDSALLPYAVGRAEADHFLCLVARRLLNFDVLDQLCKMTYTDGKTKLQLYLRCGVYLAEDASISVGSVCDRAKMAKEHITNDYIKPYAVFNKSMQDAYMAMEAVLEQFERAIRRHEFIVYYQPVMDTATERISSAEALVRWEHKPNLLISPALFIPALESNGYISELNRYVIEAVAQMLRRCRSSGVHAVPISVNLSWMDFYDEELVNWIIRGIRDGSIPRELIRYEITETSFAALEEGSRLLQDRLREESASILLDDFGSGYSSFGLLQHHCFDFVKLDMDFIQNLDNPRTREIIRSVISMSHKLGSRVVAEGAETPEQVRYLREFECDFIQGYYYYSALPEKDFLLLLQQQDDLRTPEPTDADAMKTGIVEERT